jgi:hypothetical protein
VEFRINQEQLSYLQKERGKFQYYFFSPVFKKENNIGSTVNGEFEKVTENVSRLIYKQNGEEMGVDILLFNQTDSFFIAFGTLKNRKEIESIGAQLRFLGLYPFVVSKEKMFEILENEYLDYVLREYRSGGTRLQSYFKDHTDNDVILTRLEQDKKLSLKPYRATFALKSKKKQTIEIFHDGFIITENPSLHLNFINDLIKVFFNVNVELFNFAERAVFKSKTDKSLPSLKKILFIFSNSVTSLDLFYKIQTSLTYKREESEKATITIMNQISDWHISSKIVYRNFLKEDTDSIGVYYLTVTGRRVFLSTLKGDPYRSIQIYSAIDEVGTLSEMKVI